MKKTEIKSWSKQKKNINLSMQGVVGGATVAGTACSTGFSKCGSGGRAGCSLDCKKKQ